MKILYYSPHPHLNLTDKTGYGTHMREMIQAFRDLGHEVLPVINGGTEPRTQGNKDSKSKPGLLKRAIKAVVPKYIWRTIKDKRLLDHDQKAEIELGKIVDSFKPDLIYERAYYLTISGVNVAAGKKIRYFLEINAPYIEETAEFEGTNSFFTGLAKKNEELQLKWSDRSFVVSSALKDHFLKKYPAIPSSGIVVTPNCVDPAKVKVDHGIRKKVLEKYDLKDNKVIGFVGSIFPYHGVDILIEAFNEVYKQNRNTKLLIVGDGLILEDLKSLAHKLEASANIIFTGNVPYSQVFSYIDVMDITVLAATEWYCSPIKLFEYGALGKAIVAPDTQSVKDVMEHDKDGILVKPGKEFLAGALLDLINNKTKMESVGISFRNKIENKYTWIKNAGYVLSYVNDASGT